MKIINTRKYNRIRKGQTIYDPDTGQGEELSDNNYEFFDLEPRSIDEKADYESQLPTLTPEDIGRRIPFEDQSEDVDAIETEDVEPVPEQDDFPVFDSPFAAMSSAIEKNQVVRIYYICKKGAYVIRDIEPHAWYRAKTTGNLILVTWDRDVDWYRAFIIDRIQKYEWKGEEFDPRFVFSK